MLVPFQRFISLLIMKIITEKIFSSFIFGTVMSPYSIIYSLISEYATMSRAEDKRVLLISIIANIINLLFYILMARELYLMYKINKKPSEAKEKDEIK